MDFSFKLVRPIHSRFHKKKTTRRALRLRNHRTAAVDLCLATLQPKQNINAIIDRDQGARVGTATTDLALSKALQPLTRTYSRNRNLCTLPVAVFGS